MNNTCHSLLLLALVPLAGPLPADEATAGETRSETWSWVQTDNTGAQRPFLGVVTEPVPDVLRDYVDLPAGQGLVLKRVIKDGPAAQAGLLDSDILLTFDGAPVDRSNGLTRLLAGKAAGDAVAVAVLRRGQPLEFTVTLGARKYASGRWQSALGELSGPGARVLESIHEWIPDSVRVIVDEDERVSVDLSELRANLDDMRARLEQMRDTMGAKAELQRERTAGQGTRTTVIRMKDSSVTLSQPDGTVVITGEGADRHVRVLAPDQTVLFDGPLPDDSLEQLPEAARPLVESLLDTLGDLQLPDDARQLRVELKTAPPSPQ